MEQTVKVKIWDACWDEFWPVRAMVRSFIDEGKDVNESLSSKWQDMRNNIVAKYYYLVQREAKRIAKKITEVEEDALASMGVDGLYDAVDGYGGLDRITNKWAGIDPNAGKPVKFETYAAFRIRGSIIDNIRRDDWVPRLVRARAKSIDRESASLVSALGRAPTEKEMAEHMKMELDEYQEFAKSSVLKSVQSLNATFHAAPNENRHDKDMSVMDFLCDPKTYEPLDGLIQEELKSKLFGKGFTPLERCLIEKYYFEDRAMKEISQIIGLSESRVSQMHTDIVGRLKDKVLRNPEYFGREIYEMLRK